MQIGVAETVITIDHEVILAESVIRRIEDWEDLSCTYDERRLGLHAPDFYEACAAEQDPDALYACLESLVDEEACPELPLERP